MICTKCCEDKPNDAFRPGSRMCRNCVNLKRYEWRRNNPEYLAKHREEERRRREKDPAHVRSVDNARYQKNRESRCASAQKSRASNPLRERAHTVVRLAVERGDLPPAWSMVCDVCQEAQGVDWHHPSYEESQHMNVICVCSSCHGVLHRVEA